MRRVILTRMLQSYYWKIFFFCIYEAFFYITIAIKNNIFYIKKVLISIKYDEKVIMTKIISKLKSLILRSAWFCGRM